MTPLNRQFLREMMIPTRVIGAFVFLLYSWAGTIVVGGAWLRHLLEPFGIGNVFVWYGIFVFLAFALTWLEWLLSYNLVYYLFPFLIDMHFTLHLTYPWMRHVVPDIFDIPFTPSAGNEAAIIAALILAVVSARYGEVLLWGERKKDDPIYPSVKDVARKSQEKHQQKKKAKQAKPEPQGQPQPQTQQPQPQPQTQQPQPQPQTQQPQPQPQTQQPQPQPQTQQPQPQPQADQQQ
jgi:hypothetical protein